MNKKNKKSKINYASFNKPFDGTEKYAENKHIITDSRCTLSNNEALKYFEEHDLKVSKPIKIKDMLINQQSQVTKLKELDGLVSKNKSRMTELNKKSKIRTISKNLNIEGTGGTKDEPSTRVKHLSYVNKGKTFSNLGIKKSDSVEDLDEDGHTETLEFANNIAKKDPYFGEKIADQEERLRRTSIFGKFSSWKIFRVIVKSGEDLRQEQFTTQLINEFFQIFRVEDVKCWINPYEILTTGNNVGLIECVPNTLSLDQLKKKTNSSLKNWFVEYFGEEDSSSYKAAVQNFICSLAGYSLVCYFLQIKDRHNGNILLDDKGHIIHIDFGFLLSNAPGKGIKFESAPFKLTDDFLELLEGVNSSQFTEFRRLLWRY